MPVTSVMKQLVRIISITYALLYVDYIIKEFHSVYCIELYTVNSKDLFQPQSAK